jgi:hypothetical protein
MIQMARGSAKQKRTNVEASPSLSVPTPILAAAVSQIPQPSSTPASFAPQHTEHGPEYEDDHSADNVSGAMMDFDDDDVGDDASVAAVSKNIHTDVCLSRIHTILLVLIHVTFL